MRWSMVDNRSLLTITAGTRPDLCMRHRTASILGTLVFIICLLPWRLAAAGPPTGDGDTSMAFHGADAVTVASVAGLPAGAHPYSLEAWVLPASGGAAAQGLVGYGNYAATRQAAYLRLAGATGLLHSWRNDDLTATQTASLTGTWHLAVASYDGHGRRLYLDGVPFAADAPANQPDTNVLIHGLVPWRTSTHTPPRTSTSATLTAHRC